MTKIFIPDREAQALREVGHTTIERSTAIALGIVFLLTIWTVPVLDRVFRGVESGGPLSELFSQLTIDLGADRQGLVATNRAVKRDIDQFETDLEESSWLRRGLVPALQWRLAVTVGLGNEQAYVGRDGWLFYRPDVDYVTGRGFLVPSVLDARASGGDLWEAPPQPDPLPAIQSFVAQMRQLGIRTIVLPTPVKPTIHPEMMAPKGLGAWTGPAQNASFADLMNQLEAAGVEVIDPAPLLVQAALEEGAAQYLRTDTHWTPQGVMQVAKMLAERIESDTVLSPAQTSFTRRNLVLQGFGDIAEMLFMPANQTRIPIERVDAAMVLASDGTSWRSDPQAEILLLGDSFSNVYSDASLGWGTGAGLAEQLSYELQRPIDKVAVNAGGSHAAREALRRALAENRHRLADKKVVIYQFAARELAQGDWRPIDQRPADQGLDQ